MYYYFFRPDLSRHVEHYYAWVNAARSQGLPMKLATLLQRQQAREQRAHVQYWKHRPGFDVIRPLLPGRYSSQVERYFRRVVRRQGQLTVQVHNQSLEPFIRLRDQFGERVRVIAYYEGDPISELEYVRDHPYKPGFYDDPTAAIEANRLRQHMELRDCDHAIVVTPYFKKLLTQRFPTLGLDSKLSVLPTGGEVNGTELTLHGRRETRKQIGLKDELLLTYVGNVRYSWQSLPSCLAAYQSIKQQLRPDAKLLLLVHSGQEIAIDFLNRYAIAESDYTLTSIRQEEMGRYLAASDIAFLLRPDHPSMRCGSPGKFADYTLSGLPMLLSRGTGEYAQWIEEDGLLPLIDDIDDQSQILDAATRLLDMTWDDRQSLRAWAIRRIATPAYAARYASILRSIAQA